MNEDSVILSFTTSLIPLQQLSQSEQLLESTCLQAIASELINLSSSATSTKNNINIQDDDNDPQQKSQLLLKRIKSTVFELFRILCKQAVMKRRIGNNNKTKSGDENNNNDYWRPSSPLPNGILQFFSQFKHELISNYFVLALEIFAPDSFFVNNDNNNSQENANESDDDCQHKKIENLDFRSLIRFIMDSTARNKNSFANSFFGPQVTMQFANSLLFVPFISSNNNNKVSSLLLPPSPPGSGSMLLRGAVLSLLKEKILSANQNNGKASLSNCSFTKSIQHFMNKDRTNDTNTTGITIMTLWNTFCSVASNYDPSSSLLSSLTKSFVATSLSFRFIFEICSVMKIPVAAIRRGIGIWILEHINVLSQPKSKSTKNESVKMKFDLQSCLLLFMIFQTNSTNNNNNNPSNTNSNNNNNKFSDGTEEEYFNDCWIVQSCFQYQLPLSAGGGNNNKNASIQQHFSIVPLNDSNFVFADVPFLENENHNSEVLNMKRFSPRVRSALTTPISVLALLNKIFGDFVFNQVRSSSEQTQRHLSAVLEEPAAHCRMTPCVWLMRIILDVESTLIMQRAGDDGTAKNNFRVHHHHHHLRQLCEEGSRLILFVARAKRMVMLVKEEQENSTNHNYGGGATSFHLDINSSQRELHDSLSKFHKWVAKTSEGFHLQFGSVFALLVGLWNYFDLMFLLPSKEGRHGNSVAVESIFSLEELEMFKENLKREGKSDDDYSQNGSSLGINLFNEIVGSSVIRGAMMDHVQMLSDGGRTAREEDNDSICQGDDDDERIRMLNEICFQ